VKQKDAYINILYFSSKPTPTRGWQIARLVGDDVVVGIRFDVIAVDQSDDGHWSVLGGGGSAGAVDASRPGRRTIGGSLGQPWNGGVLAWLDNDPTNFTSHLLLLLLLTWMIRLHILSTTRKLQTSDSAPLSGAAPG